MNRTRGNRRIARKAAMVATALGLWGALVLLFAAPLPLTGRISWREAVSFGGSFWALWLLFLPAVAWLSFRFPIERRRLLQNVGIHLLACLLLVGTTRATFRAVARIFPFPQRSETPGRPPDSQTDRPEPQPQRRRLPPRPPRRSLDLVGPPNALGVFLGLRAALDVLANDPPSGTFYDPDHATATKRLTSLGVHEHWNNPQDRKYSRNLGIGEGIELVSVKLGTRSGKSI